MILRNDIAATKLTLNSIEHVRDMKISTVFSIIIYHTFKHAYECDVLRNT